jgi:hypothetical protein
MALLAHLAAGIIWLVDGVIMQIPPIGVLIGLGVIGLYATTVRMLGGWPEKVLMGVPLLSTLALLIFVRSGQWDCFPDCGVSSAVLGSILRYSVLLVIVGAAAAPFLALRRAGRRNAD